MLTTRNKVFDLLERFFVFEWLFAFVLVVIARLPYLLSDHVFFDGDEAMVGIMGRDLITGKNIPFYFYGQRYGFSFFEALSVGLFIPFLGSTVWSLKFGGMLLFSLGIQRLLKAFRTSNTSQLSYLLLALVLASFPTWVVWGTKLRGGYLTAFVAIAFIMELFITHRKWERKEWIKIAAFSALTLVAQPLFIVPVSLLIALRLVQSEKSALVAGVISGATTLAVLRALVYLNPDYWQHSMQFQFRLETLKAHLSEHFVSNFTGFFAFTDNYEVPTAVKFGAIAYLIILGVLISYSLVKWSNRKAILLGLAATFISSLAIAFFTLAGGRYLLPFFTGILFLIALISSFEKESILNIFLGLILLSTFPTLTGFDKYVSYWLEKDEPDMKRLNELVEKLKSRGLTKGFVSEWQVLWQLNYLGNDEMAFRYQSLEDRVPRFVNAANDCYTNPECKTVLTGGLWPLLEMEKVEGWEKAIEKVNARYYLMENPDTTYLNAGKFELPK